MRRTNDRATSNQTIGIAMPSPTFTGKYAADGKEDRAKVREEAGHRCIRCGHPYQTGQKRDDRGEWSDCDDQCTHRGALRFNTLPDKFPWTVIDDTNPVSVSAMFPQLPKGTIIQARWRILTVHHFDGAKDNDAWWNKLALCQKCHLQIQTKVNPEIPWMFEHSEWLKPYVAGFYAEKYLKENLSREEVMARLEELLQLERRI